MSRLPLVLSSLAIVAAGAANFNAFSGDDGLGEEAIRNYLVANPGVVVEALQAAERNARLEEAEAAKSRIAAASDRLMDDGFSPVIGNPEGDVTLVMFSDYRCGYCKSAHEDLVEILGEDKNLRIIIKEFPILGEASVVAARFAHAVETAINLLAAEGWEYLRADLLPCDERSGLTGSTTHWRNLLVFRRPVGSADFAARPLSVPAEDAGSQVDRPVPPPEAPDADTPESPKP
jgi:hypothetical protein